MAEVTEVVATVALDRPPVGAVVHQTALEQRCACTTRSASREADVARFAAAGERASCAGVEPAIDTAAALVAWCAPGASTRLLVPEA